jgi:UDP-N-acetylmuramate dehydrogenase
MMSAREEALRRLAAIPHLTVTTDAPLSRYTRFGIGGPADILAESERDEAFVQGLAAARESGLDYLVIGGGTNLIVSDNGFRGIVLRHLGARITSSGNRILADAGAALQDLVNHANDRGLKGLETLAGIPGWVGAAIYGNAGAYGHSISELVHQVRFYDGERVRFFSNAECEFRYRESIFKRRKEWIVFSAELHMQRAAREELKQISAGILAVRNEKFPVTMKCAGSIFKNLLIAELPGEVAAAVPERVVREGKIPAAYFLERAGAKGLQRGGIRVADYHANLVYNTGDGTARDLCLLLEEMKRRVRERFGLELEEEVQYVGFEVCAAQP